MSDSSPPVVLRATAIGLLVLTLSGCTAQDLVDAFVPEPQGTYARDYLSLFPKRDFEAIRNELTPAAAANAQQQTLEQVADLFPSTPPVDVTVTGARTHTVDGVSLSQLSWEYHYDDPERWLWVAVAVRKAGDELSVEGFRVVSLEASLAHINRFTLQGKGAQQLSFLAALLAVAVFVVVALVSCARTPIPRRKWLWMIFIATGAGRVMMNWTTGETGFQIFTLDLPAANFKRGVPMGPWMLQISIPIGAIVFFLRRRKWIDGAPPDEPGPVSAEAVPEEVGQDISPAGP